MPCRARGVLRVLRTPVWFLFVPVDATESLRHRVLTVSRLRALYLVRVKPHTVQAEQGLSHRTPLARLRKVNTTLLGGSAAFVCRAVSLAIHSMPVQAGVQLGASWQPATETHCLHTAPALGNKTRNELIPPISLAGSWNVHVIAGLAYLLSTRV